MIKVCDSGCNFTLKGALHVAVVLPKPFQHPPAAWKTGLPLWKGDILEIRILHLTRGTAEHRNSGVADFHLHTHTSTHTHTNTDKLSSTHYHNVGCCCCNADKLQFMFMIANMFSVHELRISHQFWMQGPEVNNCDSPRSALTMPWYWSTAKWFTVVSGTTITSQTLTRC